MLDIDFIRENRQTVQQAADNKNIDIHLDTLIETDETRRRLLQEIEDVRRERNEIAAKAKDGKPSDDDIARGKELKSMLNELEDEYTTVLNDYDLLLKQIPNIPTEDTPIGLQEEDNEVVYEWGEKPEFDFKPKNHWDIAETKDWIDKERAAKVTGARFAFIKGPLVRLQLAIMQFTVNALTDESTLQEIIDEFKLEGVSAKPFVPVLPPLMIRQDVFDAMDRLEPRDDRYKIAGDELWLQGSAEHVLGAMHQGELLEAEQLPLRYLGYATSFRKEAGTYGKDMEGIIRMHQFDKLEMEIISDPESGLQEHLLTIAIQEYLLRRLEIPYQKLLKCTADIGKPNARGVDMEAWLPGQDKYRETHTADYMTDYQARRLQTRVRQAEGETAYIHTIDATAFALGRIMVAIIENYQNKDGSVRIPQALVPLMSTEVIE